MDDKARVLKAGFVILLVGLLLAGGFFPVFNYRVAADDLPLGEGPPLPTAPDEYVPDEIIVKFKEGVHSAAMAQLDEAIGTEVAYVSRYSGFRVLKIPKGKSVAEMVKDFSELPDVEYAEPNYIHQITWSPNDPVYPWQWHFDQINLEAAWDLDTSSPNYGGDSSIVVAVIDSGVAYETYGGYVKAPDLASTNFVNGWDFVNDDAHPNDDNCHGTHVCGTIAQSTNNSLGVAGIAFNTTIMPLKAFNSAGSGTTANISDAYHYAADNGADIINYSAGGPNSTTLQNATAYARNAGVVIIAAAGNDYQYGNDPSYPAAYDDYAIAVGATRYDEARSPYSNTGSYLDIAAPGGDTNVDQNSDNFVDGVLQNTFNPYTQDPTDFAYWFLDGTSMATPHVSGVAALILAQHPAWDGETDARPAALGRCANLLDAVILCGFHGRKNLASVRWWREHVAPDITQESCGLRAATFDGFLIQSAHVMLFSVVEHSMRVFLRTLCPGACQNARASFGSVYAKLLAELDMAEWRPMREIWGDLRNAIHNNGQFLPTRGKDVRVTFRGVSFSYRDGDHFSASWRMFIWLATRAKELLVDIVGSQKMTEFGVIADPYPVSPDGIREASIRFLHQCPDGLDG